MAKKLSKFSLISINLFILFVFFAALELILRIFFPVYTAGVPEFYYYDAETAYGLKKDIHILKTLDYQAEIFTNVYGTANFQDDFNDYKTIIFTVGDSFTEGTGLPSDASYPFQLNLILNIDGVYRKNYAVINLGVGGYSGKQNLLRLKRYIEQLSVPDFILYLGSNNDEYEDFLFINGMRNNHLIDGNPNWGYILKPVRWFTSELQIGLRLKLIARDLRVFFHRFKNKKVASAVNPKEAWASIPDEGNDKPKAPISVAELQKANIEELLALTHKIGAELIVSWSAFGDSYDWLKRWAGDNNVAFADWQPKVTSVKEAIPDIPMLNNHSGGHYRTWVNYLVAQAFAFEIKKLRSSHDNL